MKKTCSIIIGSFFLTTISYASAPDTMTEHLKNVQVQIDSINKVTDSLNKIREDKMMQEDMKRNEQNVNAFLAEQRNKEKKEAVRNIIIGVVLAVVLVVGLLRRRKKKN